MTADTESDEAFVERAKDAYGSLTWRERDRLFALARRGAAVQKLVAAASALVDFHNGPLETKRPDVFQLLMQRLASALPPPPAHGEPEHE